MNCRKAQKWISMQLDGECSPRRLILLEKHVDQCTFCRSLKASWEASAPIWEQLEVHADYTTSQAWADVRGRLRAEGGSFGEKKFSEFGMRLVWSGAVILVVLGLGMSGLWVFNDVFRMKDLTLSATQGTKVEWVETELPEAMSMVYQHDETGLTVIWVVVEKHEEEKSASS